MKRYVSVSLSILLLITIIIGAALWVRAFYASIQSYRSPLRRVELMPQPASTPQTGRVVIVLLGGLGYDDSLALGMPVLGQLRQAGATTAVESTPPTYSQTSWATLITGAPPDTNDAPPLDRAPDELYPLEIDTIFARARQAQLQTALLGPADWRRLIPGNQLDEALFVDEPGPQADQAILEAALSLLEDGDIELVFIHLTQIDFAGRRLGGAASPAYQQAAQTVDTYLGQISTAMDLNQSVLMVVADHGHIPDGGHGGNEVEVIWQPLVMIGDGIIPGDYSDIRQTDIAPTVSALLGLAPPTAAQGRILFEMLQISELDQTVAQLSLARQRVALANAYLPYLQGSETALPDNLPAGLLRAQAALANKNIRGALQLALLTQQEADSQMVVVKNHRANLERLQRLALVLPLILIWFAAMWRRRGFHAGSIVVAVVAAIGLYHGLFQLQGYHYSLSSLDDLAAAPFDIIRRTAVSLLVGGGLILIFLMLTREENWLTLLGTGYGFGVLTTFIFALPLCWAYWQNGFTVTWQLPAVVPAFWQMTGLFEVMASAGLGLLMPWPIMALSLLVNVIRRRLSQTRPQTGPDALPGLHL